MITKIENSNNDIANQIYTVFQSSYQIEAQLIGVSEFPPLLRSVQDIIHSGTEFYGFYVNDFLAAVIEVEVNEKQLDIHSLTVHPKYFRRGIADSLIKYTLKILDISIAIVETAVVNKPAIKLYEKHGFSEFKRWTPAHGIEKLAMMVKL